MLVTNRWLLFIKYIESKFLSPEQDLDWKFLSVSNRQVDQPLPPPTPSQGACCADETVTDILIDGWN